MTEPDLKPCPFCGGEVTTGKLVHTITHVDNEVNCPLEGMGFTNVTLWNARPEPTGAETTSVQQAAKTLLSDPASLMTLKTNWDAARALKKIAGDDHG